MRTFLAAAAALVLSTVVANATPITFSSTLSFSAVDPKLHLTSNGLNTVLNTGAPATVISNFIVATVDSGNWSMPSTALTATFIFTTPTPSGTTTDSGFVVGGQANNTGSGSLVITWPSQPVLFNFVDGTVLEVSLGGLNKTCEGSNCLSSQGPYSLSGSFRVLSGPTGRDIQVPEPLTLGIFGAGLIGMGALRRRKKTA